MLISFSVQRQFVMEDGRNSIDASIEEISNPGNYQVCWDNVLTHAVTANDARVFSVQVQMFACQLMATLFRVSAYGNRTVNRKLTVSVILFTRIICIICVTKHYVWKQYT